MQGVLPSLRAPSPARHVGIANPGAHASHASHAPDPSSSLFIPAGHALHAPALGPPQPVRKKPGGQTAHTLQLVFHSAALACTQTEGAYGGRVRCV